MSLLGKTVVITGAGLGLGRAIALRLAEDGALVAANYQRNGEAATALAREIEVAGGQAFALQGNGASPASIRRFFVALDAELRRRRGSERFDILVNNAGIGRIGEADDIASAAAFLASDDARWVTGQYIEASGGSGLV
jgi:3-oxoacyl-[acyl-carrier protein] reductase